MTSRQSVDSITIPVGLLCEFVDWFARNDGRADDFGRLQFVAVAEDLLDAHDPAIRTRMGYARLADQQAPVRKGWWWDRGR